MNPESELYRYRAVITDIYDGDSVTADIDLGLGIWAKSQKLRLHGIDTPEIRGSERPAGLMAKSHLVELLLPTADTSLVHEERYHVVVETFKDIESLFGDLFGKKKGPPGPKDIPLERRVELQKDMIFKLAERIQSLEATVEKLKANNNKTIPQVQKLTKRVGELEQKGET